MPSESEQSVLILTHALAQWDIVLDPAQERQFQVYAEMLMDWNATRMNLTRLTAPAQIAVLHFLDSLALSQIVSVPRAASVLDIGTGAGFPGLPLKILRPDLHLTLMEATAKKLTFCQAVADALELRDVQTVHARAEEIGQGASTDRYDLVTARAVAPMAKLLHWATPYLSDSRAAFVAWKGARAEEEMHEASSAARGLGVTMRLKTVALPPVDGQEIEHYYVICQKQRS